MTRTEAGTYNNTASVTVKDNEGSTASDTATAAVTVTDVMPVVDLVKSVNPATIIVGDVATFTLLIQNNSPEPVTISSLTDSNTLSDQCLALVGSTLAAGATTSCTYTITKTEAGTYDNTASVTVKDNEGNTASDEDTETITVYAPKVEIIKTGPAYATSGETIQYTFTINNLSSANTPNLMLDTLTDTVLGNLADEAPEACDELASGESCTFTVSYTVGDAGLQAYNQTNVVTVHYDLPGFPNDITDSGDHKVLVVPKGQLTDTMWCPLPDNQFRLLNRIEVAPNIYRLRASNPGQFYYNAFYSGEPGDNFTMTIEIPYPFITQEGAGVPIQVHDGSGLTANGCFMPTPSLNGFGIETDALAPVSSAGNQIITPEDYEIKQLGESTTVTITGLVPDTGLVYVTIHLDYGLKKTGGWKPTGTTTVNPETGAKIADVSNGTITIHGYEEYDFSREVDGDIFETTPASYNEFKKFAGFAGFVTETVANDGDPVEGVKVVIYDPKGKLLTTIYTDADGYYMYPHKHTAKAATYTVKLPDYGKSTAVTIKANGFAAVDFEI
jgi:uncharacterized repeat protein (TIGR01451 family)